MGNHKNRLTGWLATVLLFVCLPAQAYEFEIRALFDTQQFDTIANFAAAGPMPGITVRTNNNNDELHFNGVWYFNGVNATSGPLSRAAFIDQASFLSVGIVDGSGDTSASITSSDPLFPPVNSSGDTDTLEYAASARYVWKDSGWFATAGLSKTDFDLLSEGIAGSAKVDMFSVGAGKYIGPQTTLEIDYVQSDGSTRGGPFIGSPGKSAVLSAIVSHIGNLGSAWQYGLDATLSSVTDGDAADTYAALLSLYPSRHLALGFGVNGRLEKNPLDATNLSFGASWFVIEKLELVAIFETVITDDAVNSSSDSDRVAIGASLRF